MKKWHIACIVILLLIVAFCIAFVYRSHLLENNNAVSVPSNLDDNTIDDLSNTQNHVADQPDITSKPNNDIEVKKYYSLNDSANIINQGFAAQEGDTIVYVDGYTGMLLATDSEFSNKRVYDGILNAKNVLLKGEWIYYINSSSNSLHKLKLDGTENITIADKDIAEAIVTDQFIYYIGKNNNIYQMDLDGLNVKQLNQEYCNNICFYNDKIYYINRNRNEIYRMNMDGSDQEKISQENLIGSFIIVNDFIYAVKSNCVLKMKTDGSVSDIFLNEKVAHINFDENYFYYTTNRSGSFIYNNYTLFRIDHGGKEKMQLSDNCRYINVLNASILGWVPKTYKTTDYFFSMKKGSTDIHELFDKNLNYNTLNLDKMNQFAAERFKEGMSPDEVVETVHGQINTFTSNPKTIQQAVIADIDMDGRTEMVITYTNIENSTWQHYLSVFALENNQFIEIAKSKTPDANFITIDVLDIMTGGNKEIIIMDDHYEYPAFSIFTYENQHLVEQDTNKLGLNGINQFVSFGADRNLIYHRVTDGFFSGSYYIWDGTQFVGSEDYLYDGR
ncbi:MAG TPA: DUF5050 domain-containing protein [Clostridiaceae bacterium]|nr:DUF5050 domain-containing protein [Clostridiaceae bacterium]